LRARRFPDVIKLLEINIVEGVAPEYRNSFDFFYILAVACMYQGDMGGANTYLQQARKIKMRDTRLLAAEGAFFLHRGDTARAVEYYLETLDSDPGNKTAKKALAFIKDHGDSEAITELIETGKIKRFFPPLGIHPGFGRAAVTAAILAALFCAAFFVGIPALKNRGGASGGRAEIPDLRLTADEEKNVVETDPSQSAYLYILNERQIKDSYAAALKYFYTFRDNAAQVEINRILNSNAAPPIRRKARLMMDYFVEPTFDTIKDDYPYKTVAADPALYLDCFVSWSGRVANLGRAENPPEGELLVGYENLQTVEGRVPLVFVNNINIDPGRPVRVLGRLVMLDDKKLALKVKSLYQPLSK
jgi:hypothetical protein